jgi:DHA3 family tetracycline resistance protein-like MFS transporter
MFIAMTVYRVQIVGMTPLQLVLVGTVLEITCFTFEVPTGVVADTYSRRLSVVLGFVLIGAGYALEGLISSFAISLVAQVIAGIGYTFISGALEAWITDEIGQEKAGKAFLRSSQLASFAGIVATLIGVGLASVRLNLPIVLGSSALFGLGIFLALTMTEHGFTPTPRGERTSWQAMGHTFTEGLKVVRGSSLLINILIIAVILGAFSEGFDRLSEAHFLKNFSFPTLGSFEPVVWLGLIGLCARLINLAATELVRRRVDTTSHTAVARALFIFNSLLMGAMILFGLAGNFTVAVGAFWLVSVCRNMGGPLQSAWLNQNVESRVRATVFSMNGQADAIGQMAGGPIVGVIGNISLRLVMILAGLILLPALALYRRSMRYDKPAIPVGEMPNISEA